MSDDGDGDGDWITESESGTTTSDDSVADLLDNIDDARKALASCPSDHPDRAGRAVTLGYHLYMAYRQTDNISFIDEAIEVEREALALRPLGHPDRASCCGNLGSSLRVRYEQTGDVTLLDQAIELKREALALQPGGHPSRANSFRDLKRSLDACDQKTGGITLLDEVVELEREALALRPPGHPDRASSCANLGSSLYVFYQQTGGITLLDEAIELGHEALALRPLGHPDRAISCIGLAVSLHARYKRTGDVTLLDEAIDLKRESMMLQPPGHPHRGHSCVNLGYSLHARYQQTGDVVSSDEAIEACIHALEHSSTSGVWCPLVQLSALPLFCDSPHYSVLKALEYLQQFFQNEVDIIQHFISNVCYAAALSVWTPHITALLVDVYAKVVDRLPLMAGFVLDTSSQLRTLKATRQVGSDACVAALLAEQPATALTLLDRAHGIVWTQALHQRDPQMEGAPKDLTIELEDLLRAIAAPMPADSAILPDHPQDLRHRQNIRIQAILEEIRGMPGLARFMLGSTYETLREAACDHPVVVLVAARGYAFALIMATAVQDEPHTLRLDLTSDDLLSLRDSARQAGLRSGSDTRDGNIDERMRVQISKMNVDHQSFRVLADVWRKIVKPVIYYLGLEVCSDQGMYFSPR
jgi:tetratricopeptide (TPR) repeat protein